MRRRAFTLIELLVVVAVIAILAAMLFPVFSQAKAKAQQASCMSNLRQIGVAMMLYESGSDDRMPDRRDLKLSLPAGYRPWAGWPPSDPRIGWAAVVLQPYVKSGDIWRCPGIGGSTIGDAAQVAQDVSPGGSSLRTNYWMWRFDRPDDPVPLDNFWGKTNDQALTDLQAADNPVVGNPQSISDVELTVDPYFPSTIKSVPPSLLGRSVHFGGRNRLFLDTHVRFLRDPRTR